MHPLRVLPPPVPPSTVPGERRTTWASLLGKPTSLDGAGLLSTVPHWIAPSTVRPSGIPAGVLNVVVVSPRTVGYHAYGVAQPGRFVGNRFNASWAAPSAVGSGHQVAFFAGAGKHSTGWHAERAGVSIVAGENWTATAGGARIEFETTANATTTRTIQHIMTEDGHLEPHTARADLLDFGRTASRYRDAWFRREVRAKIIDLDIASPEYRVAGVKVLDATECVVSTRFKVGANQVVGTRGGAIANADGSTGAPTVHNDVEARGAVASVAGTVNSILGVMRTHGLIAT